MDVNFGERILLVKVCCTREDDEEDKGGSLLKEGKVLCICCKLKLA